ncbi:MAG: hypothetical protein KA785_06505 [Spirochaetaceae bacterium]|nr:hypothetical protein [Spirochaetaceae bacterium]
MIIEPESHHLVKTVLIPQIIKLLMENYAINENKALQIMYTSPTGRCLDDDSLGLYGQSALFLYGLIEEDIAYNPELINGSNTPE